jgi:hypothetical protein
MGLFSVGTDEGRVHSRVEFLLALAAERGIVSPE